MTASQTTATTAGFGRRHVSKVLFALAFVGVPAAVVMGSGGPHTLGFWWSAAAWLPISFYVALPLGIMLMVALAPVYAVLSLFIKKPLLESVKNWVVSAGWFVLAAISYVARPEFDDSSDVLLPTPWPGVGSLIVVTIAGGIAYGLYRLGQKLVIDEPRQWTPPPDPDLRDEPDEEFWSDQLVEGWRCWRWDGEHLKGVFAVWESHTFEARCDSCQDVPGWGHSCGVYATKEVGDVQRFPSETNLVGRVEMWGRVIEHEHGYRASHARITELWADSSGLARNLGNAYPGVRIRVRHPILKTMERK